MIETDASEDPSMRRLTLSPVLSGRLADSGLDVVVTGAGGWLGRATLEMMESCLGPSVATRVHAFASSSRTMLLRSGTALEVRALSDLAGWSGGSHLVVHYAFVTREHVTRLGLAEYVRRNEAITALVAGHVASHRPAGTAMVSSGAVHLGEDPSTNPYGVLKARDERTFLELARQQRSVGPEPRLVIPRLFNLAGPFLNKVDDYVLGSILSDIALGGPIRIRATRPVVRSYVHVESLIELLFAAMLGEQSLPMRGFDTAGERSVEVGELAALADSVLGHPDMAIHRPPLESTSQDRYVGDPTIMNDLVAALGIAMHPLPDQIVDTARFLRE